MTNEGKQRRPGGVLNADERPRVLLMVDEALRPQFEFIKSLSGTYRLIEKLSEVDSREWDAIITDTQLAAVQAGTASVWSPRFVPLGLNVFHIHDPNRTVQHPSVMDYLDRAERGSSPKLRLREQTGVPGKHVFVPTEIPDDIAQLVKKVLVPVINARSKQFGHRVDVSEDADTSTISHIPFLVGPDDLVLAGNYLRSASSEVWIVPADLPEFQSWYLLALKQWHRHDPIRFPGQPDWTDAPEWMTLEEAKVAEQIAELTAEFDAQAVIYTRKLDELYTLRQDIRDQANNDERPLLFGQGEALQTSVQRALEFLGFSVRDMDIEWEERERREDYRITDPDAPGWLAVGDATGVAKGVKGTKIQSLSGFVSKYLLEQKPDTMPAQWLIFYPDLGTFNIVLNTKAIKYRDV